ncbi:hypothetical protein HS088_TW18G00528 [Tripterygium wilfordii]|uniref:NPH3 domain-containing protein n=1 Tax=Tripterygium wilfordii TaxID=458696 RepID=A0A7J7CCI9_TRIWF|nr:hypothetical protein HS088_TW18G00528 [Tripterygium wilfordii]
MKAALCMDSGDMVKGQLIRRIGQQLEGASINDLLILTAEGGTVLDVDTIKNIVEEFLMQDWSNDIDSPEEAQEVLELRRPGILSDASKLMVEKLTDAYLAEIAKDHNLPLSKFVELANMVSGIPRPAHDGLYCAIDIYLKVRMAASSGCSTPDPHRSIRDLNYDFRGSSRSATTNPEEELDPAATAEELRALKRELASSRLSTGMATIERNGE